MVTFIPLNQGGIHNLSGAGGNTSAAPFIPSSTPTDPSSYLTANVLQLHATDANAITAKAGLFVNGAGVLFNGATYDRQRGNVDTGTIVTLTAAGLQTTTSANQTNWNGRGVLVTVNVTSISGTSPTLTVTLQGVDSATGAVYTLLASAALNATGTTALTVYPGCVAVANSVANLPLPRTWNIKYVIGGTTPSVTATIGASVLV